MDACREISCLGYWDALVVGCILEERGIQVRRPDEAAPLTMVATGPLDVIKAGVAQFGHEFPGADAVAIEGERLDPAYHIVGTLRIDEPGPSTPGPRQCRASTAKGSQCKLPAEPGAAVCAIHAHPLSG
jgi:hypothetical protein